MATATGEGGGQAAGPRDLLTLQNLIKRDPSGYEEEFKQQFRHFEAMLGIFELNPSKDSRPFQDLVTFLSHVSSCYPALTKELPEQLMTLLERNHAILDGKLRKTVVRALMLLRTKGVIDPVVLLTLFFKLFRVKDKGLRHMLYEHIVSDIRNVNRKRRDNRLNGMLQNLLYTMIADRNRTAAKLSLDVMIELYRKGIWTDAKTVNVISNACFVKKHAKMKTAALKFFVTDNDLDVGDASSDEGPRHMPSREEAMNAYTVASKTRSRKRRLDRALARINKASASPKKPSLSEPNFPAIELLYDPQGFAEKLFGQLKGSTDRFEVRLMVMDLISRCIAVHELILLNFYPWMQRYMTPHQAHITLILAIVAQSCHELVPPEAVEPVIQTLVYHFVTDRSSPDVMTVGLNTAREIARRCPLAMNATLLQDLIQYKNSKAKGVAMAARSLLALFRAVNPALLIRRDRGKDASTGGAVSGPVYGQRRVAETVTGADLLESMRDVEVSEDGGESDSDGGWIDCESDSDSGSGGGGGGGSGGSNSAGDGGECAAASEGGDAESDGYEWLECEAGEDGGSSSSGEWCAVSHSDDGGAGADAGCGFEAESGAGEAESAWDAAEWMEVGEGEDCSDCSDCSENEMDVEAGAGAIEAGAAEAAAAATAKRAAAPLSATALSKQVVSQRLLTDADFERIRKLRALQESMGETTSSGRKRKRRASMDEGDDGSGVDPLVREGAIDMFRKRAKMTKAEKRQSVEEGRPEDKPSFGPAKFTEGKKAGQSRTDSEKTKTKNFVMMKHKRSVLEKVKKSIIRPRKLKGQRKNQPHGKAHGQK